MIYNDLGGYKMKKKIIVFISIVALISLAACSSGKKSSTAITNQKEKSYQFYKDAKKNSRIYYILDLNEKNFGRETVIDAILYTNKGKYTYYEVPNGDTKHTLAELKKLSDKQVLNQAKKWNKELAESYVQKGIEETNQSLQDTKDDYQLNKDAQKNLIDMGNKNLEFLNEYKYEEPKELPIEVKAEADESGNKLKKEYLVLPVHNFKIKCYESSNRYGYSLDHKIQFYYPKSPLCKYELSPTQMTSEVYDKKYSYGQLGSNLVLATKGSQLMELDELNEKGLLDINADSINYKTEKDEEGDYYITWE